jgi:ABC-type sulfate transport system permease component
MKTQIVPLLIMTKLEEFDYAGATALAVVMLVFSFVLLLAINVLQWWTNRYNHHEPLMTPAASPMAQLPSPSGLRPTTEPPLVRRLLIGIALLFLTLFLFLPLASVFVQAFAKGIGFYLKTLSDPMAWSADQTHADYRGNLRAFELRVRCRGCLGNCQI